MKKMTKTFINKNIQLLLEFDRYIMRHRRIRSAIPNGATVIMTVAGDEKFNEASRGMVAHARRRKVVEACKHGSRWTVRPVVKVK